MRILFSTGIGLILATNVLAEKNEIEATESPELKIVREFVKAFNAHDVDKMMKLVAEDVEWLNVDGRKLSLQTAGRDDTAAAMRQYFASTPTVRSGIVEAMVAGSFVSIQERVHWKQGSHEASQASLAVYQIRKGRISRVWYYPAED